MTSFCLKNKPMRPKALTHFTDEKTAIQGDWDMLTLTGQPRHVFKERSGNPIREPNLPPFRVC